MEFRAQSSSLSVDRGWAKTKETSIRVPAIRKRERHYGDRIFSSILKTTGVGSSSFWP